MNKLIKEQLRNVKTANLGEWDDNTSHFLIPKYIPVSLLVNHRYVLRLSESAFSQELNHQWNNGDKPRSKNYNCTVERVTGRMAFISGYPCFADGEIYPASEKWSGWIPEYGMLVLSELTK